MYEIRKKKYHKLQVCLGIIPSILSCVLIYQIIAHTYYRWDSYRLLGLFLGILFPLFTLYHLIKYFDKKNNYVVFKIDDYGILLHSVKNDSFHIKNEDVFIPWEKIKYVTFVYDNFVGTKVAILQYNKKSHYMLLTDYFYFLRIHFYPRGAVKAAYKYADNVKKIKEKEEPFLSFYYESGTWRY